MKRILKESISGVSSVVSWNSSRDAKKIHKLTKALKKKHKRYLSA
jgi:hypothetical protein